MRVTIPWLAGDVRTSGMGRIRLLPDIVASQVAAGEVVERPASVVKELVENSIDAGAGRVDVDYQRGGIACLSVTDDGRGMDREDAVLCLERHATSKIRTGSDLASVATFGFRGEALPSIASVSRFRLCTREREAAAGTEVTVAGGRIEDVRDSGEAPGTRIEVRSIFYNLPARRKFLRGERTEAAHIDHQFEVLALAHPEVRFSLTRDGKQSRLLAPADDLPTRVRDLCGAEFFGQLFEFEPFTSNGVSLRGLLGRPGHGRGDRTGQFVFVNGRAVFSSTISQPLRDAYATALPKGMHPAAVLFVSVDPELVDCNVHPAKREVRFRDGISVREAVHEGVRRALESQRRTIVPARVFPEPSSPVPVPPQSANHAPPAFVAPAMTAANVEPTPAVPEAPVLRTPVPAPPPSAIPLSLGRQPQPERFRFAGVLGDRYAILEDDEGMVLLDNRAARERIIFEQLLGQIRSRTAVSQRLLMPVVAELAPKDFAWVLENTGLLASAGLLVEPFGSATVKIDGVPPILDGLPAGDILLRVADDCRAGGAAGRVRAVEEAIARSVSRSASLPGLPSGTTEVRRLMDVLMACEQPYTCPNGRPTMIHFSYGELDRKFGRPR